jgi:hypothetical protein
MGTDHAEFSRTERGVGVKQRCRLRADGAAPLTAHRKEAPPAAAAQPGEPLRH